MRGELSWLAVHFVLSLWLLATFLVGDLSPCLVFSPASLRTLTPLLLFLPCGPEPTTATLVASVGGLWRAEWGGGDGAGSGARRLILILAWHPCGSLISCRMRMVTTVVPQNRVLKRMK